MTWKFYENPMKENSWVVPTRVRIQIPIRPEFIAEDDSGVRIGILGRREYLANLVYQHADCCIYFYIEANFDLNISETKGDFEVAGLMVGDIYAEAALTGDEKSRFLEAATDPCVYNQLFKMCQYELLAEIRIVRPTPRTDFKLSQKPRSKND